MDNQHLKDDLYQQTRTFYSGQHNRKGPGVRLWIDGPPGTGKTELAMAYAKAMDLPYDVITMSQVENKSQLMSRIRGALSKNPFTVIILDEVDKTPNKKDLESLLTMMNQELFTYNEEKNGQKVARRASASNATVICTANTIGNEVAQVYSTFTPEEKERSGFDLLKKTREFLPHTTAVELIAGRGIPLPLIDRFGSHVSFAFYPTTKGMKEILKIKLRSLKKQIIENWKVLISTINLEKYLNKQAEIYRAENLSPRAMISAVEAEAQKQNNNIYENRAFEEGVNLEVGPVYNVDITTGKFEKRTNVPQCERFFIKGK